MKNTTTNTNANNSFKKKQITNNNNQFRKKPLPEVINPILTMDFPVFTTPTITSSTSSSSEMYKAIVKIDNKETVKKQNTDLFVLREDQQKMTKEEDEDEPNPNNSGDILQRVIAVQKELDKNQLRYKTTYIELYGENEYNRNYTMTDSHLYNSTDEENNTDDDNDNSYDYESE